MRPSLFVCDVPSVLRGNVKPLSKLSDGQSFCPKPAEITHVFFREFCGMMLSAFVEALTILGKFIVRVILICPEEQMRRIYASWNIALVKNAYAVGDCTIMEFPTANMSARLSCRIDHFERAVSATQQRAHPNPTSRFRYALDLLEEPFRDRLLGSHCRTSLQVGYWLGADSVLALPASFIIG